MKQYIVLSKLSLFGLQEERQFDKKEDACAFKELLERSDEGGACKREYYVAEILKP